MFVRSIKICAALLTLSFSHSSFSKTATDFTKIPLQDQDGHKISIADFKGKYVFISFIYTTCAMPKMCPLTVQLNRELHDKWKAMAAKEPLQILFVTLDPKTDTPPIMKSFAETRKLDSPDFVMATGSEENIDKLSAVFSASAAPGIESISHTPTSVLLDSNLKLKKVFDRNLWMPEDVLDQMKVAFDDPSRWKMQIVTLDDFKIDRAFPAMSGPTKRSFLSLNLSPGVKRAWIKGLDVEAFSSQSKKQMPLHYLCHAWLAMNDSGMYSHGQAGLMTISEGMGHSEFPPGYGMLVNEGDTSIQLTAQAVNDDPEMRDNLNYRFKVYYVEDTGTSAKPELTELRQFTFSAHGPPVAFEDGGACVEGNTRSRDGLSGHFLVPPGHHVYEKTFHQGLFASRQRIHSIKLHLHRFGQSMALVDDTIGKTLWSGKAHYKHGQIVAVDSYTSAEGIELRPDHVYKVVAEYNNWTKKNSSGMAVLRTYISPQLPGEPSPSAKVATK